MHKELISQPNKLGHLKNGSHLQTYDIGVACQNGFCNCTGSQIAIIINIQAIDVPSLNKD